MAQTWTWEPSLGVQETLTNKVNRAELERFVAGAQKAGFLKAAPDLSRLVETP